MPKVLFYVPPLIASSSNNMIERQTLLGSCKLFNWCPHTPRPHPARPRTPPHPWTKQRKTSLSGWMCHKTVEFAAASCRFLSQQSRRDTPRNMSQDRQATHHMDCQHRKPCTMSLHGAGRHNTLQAGGFRPVVDYYYCRLCTRLVLSTNDIYSKKEPFHEEPRL